MNHIQDTILVKVFVPFLQNPCNLYKDTAEGTTAIIWYCLCTKFHRIIFFAVEFEWELHIVYKYHAYHKSSLAFCLSCFLASTRDGYLWSGIHWKDWVTCDSSGVSFVLPHALHTLLQYLFLIILQTATNNLLVDTLLFCVILVGLQRIGSFCLQTSFRYQTQVAWILATLKVN